MQYRWEQSIVQKGHPALSTKAVDVDISDITRPELQSMLTDMRVLLAREYDGVALAAPQVGAAIRLFVVSPRAFRKLHPLEPLVYINPTITKRSKQTKTMEEGCLSVRGWYGKTIRNTSVTVTAYNERGQRFTREATGLLAHIFQHEIDHLDGILFDDHAVDIEKIEVPGK
jgi:peptide deformylase